MVGGIIPLRRATSSRYDGRLGQESAFHGAFQPHLDQMQHAPINDPARYRL
jgi:hypothetical protein